jgi:conjugal transfer mating pair stabilization protein TraG
MEYTIYTYGGGELLVSVFNSVAQIFKSDNTYLTPIGTMALTLGGIYAGIKATFKGDIAVLGQSWLVPSLVTFLLMFSPKSTVWIKDEVALTAAVKIDHIPIGISFFTSISSSVAHHLSTLIEETMLPANQGRATSTGILYGAKAAAKVRDIQIQDPTLLRNTKEYLRQCFMKPYVIGNFGGHRENSIKATDLLDYLDKNPVKCFGIKPTYKDGSVGKFMTCTEAGKMIKADITAESKSPLLMKQFAASIGISASNEELMNRRIKSMTTDIFKYLEQGQEDVHEWMKQSMMLNANRESYDDWREKVGHPRVFPELVKMQATRGLFQQSMGSIIGAEMSESMIPAAAQPTMLALVVMLFVIVLPFALLPGGWSYIVTGVKLLIWVSSWPVFYTIIHAISMIQLKDSIGAWGESGLSLIGQAGFTQLIMMKHAASQSLITATPLISFAIVFGSPYALSSIAGSIAGVGAANSIGSNMADGNLSMAQVANNNTTKGQHNERATLTFGSAIEDGAMRIQSDHAGRQVITEYGDNLVHNINGAESVTASSSMSLNNAKTDMAALTQREGQTATAINAKSTDLAKSFASGDTTINGLSKSSQETLKNSFGVTQSDKSGTSIVDSKSTGTNANVTVGVPSALTAVTGVGGSVSTNASNNLELRKDMSRDEVVAYNKAIEEVQSATKDDRINSTNSEDTRLAQSLRADLTTQDQIATDKAKTQQEIDTYSNQVSYAQTNAGTINKNLNEPFLQEVMARHSEISSKQQALDWSRSHREESDAIARDVIKQNNPFESPEYKSWVENIEQDTPLLQNLKISTPDSLESKYQENAQRVEEQAVVKDTTGATKPIREVVGNAANKSNLQYDKDIKEVLTGGLSPTLQEANQKLDNERNKAKKSTAKEINDSLLGIENKPISSKSTIYRAAEEVSYNAGLSDRAIQEKKIIIPGFKDKDDDKK